MPNGFVGRPASAYLGKVSDEMASARSTTTQNIEIVNESLQASINANTEAGNAIQNSRARAVAMSQPSMMMLASMQGSAASASIGAAIRALSSQRIREPRPVRTPNA